MNTDETNGLSYPAGHVPTTVPTGTHARLYADCASVHARRFGWLNPNLSHWLAQHPTCSN